MNPKRLKKLLMNEIKNITDDPHNYCFNPDSDFTRKRKISMTTVIQGIIGMESRSLTNEIIELFNSSSKMPTASAFIQQRSKIKPEAFKMIFDRFTNTLIKSFKNDMSIIAVDGSDLHIPTNQKDEGSHIQKANSKGYNLIHLNVLFDLKHQIYLDSVIQKRKNFNEHKALIEMIERSALTKALIIADRGYESYNNMAHIQEKGWFYLIRIRDCNHGIKRGIDTPSSASYDIDVSFKLTRKQSKETKELFKDKNHYRFVPTTSTFDYLPINNKKSDSIRFYELNFRMVRFQISENTYETILTNLDRTAYPDTKIKELYASRWGIETSFRDLKYTVGLLNFHSKKAMCIQQEIYAHLIIYNFTQMITSHVAIDKKQRKYTYKANFSVAVHMCRLFYRGKTTLPDLEAIIAKNLVPIRPNRCSDRIIKVKIFHGFLYRVA